MERLSQAFRALGDPTRLRILRLVAETPLNVTELVSVVGIAQSSVSHHLAKLKGIGLLREERQAGFSYHSLAVSQGDPAWSLIRLAQAEGDPDGDKARLADLLRRREDRQALNERLLEPGQSWSLWANALGALLPPLDVVDFGCGTAQLSIAIARWARSVVAVDRSKSALAQARARVKKAAVKNITFRCEDLHALSLPAAEHDLVVISQSLHHVEDPARVLQEAARILRPAGKVMVFELFPHEERWVLERLGHRHLGISPEVLQDALESAGFRNIALEPHPRDGAAPFRAYLLTAETPRRRER